MLALLLSSGLFVQHFLICIHKNNQKPDEFVPERWRDNAHKDKFWPFGLGVRSCKSSKCYCACKRVCVRVRVHVCVCARLLCVCVCVL